MQWVASAQEIAAKLLDVAAGGLMGAMRVQAVPFQDSASALCAEYELPVMPTAMQLAAAAQDKALRTARTGSVCAGSSRQVLPFQPSLNGTPVWMSLPTAMHRDVLAHDTADSAESGWRSGAASLRQAPWLKDWVNGESTTPACADPTAMHHAGLGQDTDASPFSVGSGLPWAAPAGWA